MVRRQVSVAATASLLLLSTLVTASAPPDLDQWVAHAMRTFDVPGIGLAIVKDDAVVIAKGYGVRKLGEPAPVNAETLFGIASNTIWKDRELRADAYVTFALKPDGSIDQAKMQAVSPDTDFSFDFQDLVLRPVTDSTARH